MHISPTTLLSMLGIVLNASLSAQGNCLDSIYQSAKAPRYRITELPPLALSGATVEGVGVLGINVKSTIVGSTVFNGITLPTQWVNGTARSLAVNPKVGGAAYAINNRGVIAGMADGVWDGGSVPAIWDNGKLIELPEPGPDQYGFALDINEKGQVVGYFRSDATVSSTAFLFENGNMVMLGPPPGFGGGVAVAINQSGEIIGDVASTSGNRLPVRWKRTQASLLDLPIGEIDNAIPVAINDAGTVVGSGFKSNSNFSVAIQWSSSDKASVIAAPPGWQNIFPIDIGNSGIIVGQLGINDGSNMSVSGFLQTNGVTYDLQCLLVNPGGWDIGYARAISERGEIIGVGTLDGRRVGFKLEPVKP